MQQQTDKTQNFCRYFAEYPIIQCADSSFSLYNTHYQQGYHSKSLGAYNETLYKHIVPVMLFQESLHSHSLHDFPSKLVALMKNPQSFNHHDNLSNLLRDLPRFRPLRILDICFGLGFNAFMTLHYFVDCEIYSPEKNNLLKTLRSFPYPAEFASKARDILENLDTNGVYQDNNQILYFLHGDALEFLQTFPKGFFDVVFQDAFSQSQNPELWSIHYFEKLFALTANRSIITTYAKAKNILESAQYVGFKAVKHALGSVFFKDYSQ
ncbi:hypothetical protein CQA66_00405 [Helicobacter aurati]|uniref:MnmC-like methyltransferase domain-containing protein n=1 Tax=Helicobacter aurati TaxID=137778 RepID=A0A3D8J910_9HELI|nr:MnmC family methyltransferase [Helicobacter aurati]RDU73685.1 hypothetical protein CQA66_00405 [Helicobacter aurati]